MWRPNPIRDNPDSDQSISDEEDFDDHFLENVVSLNASARNEEELSLPVRLDFLRGARGSSSSFEKPIGAPIEDEVELPDFEEGDFNRFLGEVVANSSDEEMTSEDKGNTVFAKFVNGSGTRELHKNGPRFIRNEQVRDMQKEYESILRVKESASCSSSHGSCSKANRSGDGIWSKTYKHEPFGPLISNCDNSVSLKIHRLPQITEAVHPGTYAYSVGSYLEADDKMGKYSDSEPAETEALAYGFNLHSMADLVDNLQDKADLYLPHHSQRRGKKVQPFLRRSTSHLRDNIVNGEDSPEPMDSGSSSDNEVSDQNMKIALPEKRMQTMADRFQEALGASCVTDEGIHVAAQKSFGAGIFGNLQRVMQKEKERDMKFWKKLPTGASPDSGLGCVDIKIISRYLDAKLTVCCCSFRKYTEEFLLPDNSKGMVYDGRERTVIFSKRVCDNVDLEVGNLIRIHPPWKEVQMGDDNIIILCTYFSEIPYPV